MYVPLSGLAYENLSYMAFQVLTLCKWEGDKNGDLER